MFEKKKAGQVVGSSIGLVKSINWMVKSKVHAVNMSVAGADNKVVRAAIEKGKKKGLIFVAAAGNLGKKGNKPAFSAAYKRVFAVTALNEKKLVYSHANQGKYIDFAAPGVKIWTAVPGGGRFQSGTSMASPFISVMIAQERAKSGTKSGAVRKKLKGAARDLGKKGKIFGYGLVISKPNC
jgi:subtilisin family serine protease